MTETAQIGLRPRNIGARVKRVEDPRLLTGQGMFTDDRAVAGAVHVAFQRAVHAHAVISGIDVGSAAEIAGGRRHLHGGPLGESGQAGTSDLPYEGSPRHTDIPASTWQGALCR